MYWINIQDTWFDFERVRYFYFCHYDDDTKRIYFLFFDDKKGASLFFDLDDREEEKEIRQFLEDLIEEKYDYAKFTKKEKKPEKKAAPERKKKEERLGFLSEKYL